MPVIIKKVTLKCEACGVEAEGDLIVDNLGTGGGGILGLLLLGAFGGSPTFKITGLGVWRFACHGTSLACSAVCSEKLEAEAKSKIEAEVAARADRQKAREERVQASTQPMRLSEFKGGGN